MPIYEYECAEGHHTERIRKYEDRDNQTLCHLGHESHRVVSRTHCPPDGVYSYAPNTGDPVRFERQREAIKSGTKVIPRVPKMDPSHRDGSITPKNA